jgi:tripartite-type tricarboxylate transporter receptor subunit TctC
MKINQLAKSLILKVLLALTALAGATVPTFAQSTWPSKPVRFVVAYPPGGLADVLTRHLQQPLAEALGQPLVIDNRGGVNGNLAAETVISGGADGHTFLVAQTAVESINPSMFQRMSFDPTKALVHVALLANSQLYLVTRSTLAPENLKDFVKYARAHPGKLTYGSAGTGSTPHLAGELFKQNANVFAIHVPYRGVAPAMQDVMAGQIDYAFVPATALPSVRAGKLKVLAVASKTRTELSPGTPTFAEEGFGNVFADSLFGVYAPAGTRPEVVERLSREINKILSLPSVKARYSEVGAQAMPTSPAAFKAMVQAETQIFSSIVKARNITPD